MATPPVSETEVTVDALAQEFSLPVSTVRMYQNKRILPPPVKRGRVGFYDEPHRTRLKMIAALQDRGFSLAAIKATLDSWDEGASVDQLIGTSTALPGLREQEYVQLTVAELEKRFGKGTLSAVHLRKAGELGLVKIEGKKVMASQMFLDAGTELLARGVGVGEIIDEFTAMKGNIEATVDRFMALFDRHLWQPFVDDGSPAGEFGKLAGDVDTLVTIARKIVLATLDQELRTRADERLASLKAE